MKKTFQLLLTILTFFIILELGFIGEYATSQQRRPEQCYVNIPNKSGKCVPAECKAACTKMHKVSASICLPPGTCHCYYFCS
ncbi:PREDICTED: putative defensin-like protein 146 [Camelina sativa]|uniref:Defensin-like protein 146 n=1 Tax=Camelina sativa TaxID=90675 RepID=A0ABM1Q7K2_CAMSA|nr:PREDICTED: putative defensin-like protein 146 [Camelina sativa]